MKLKNQSKSSVILNEERETAMNTQTKSKSMIKMLEFLFVLFAVLVLSSCSSKARAEDPSCYIDMGMRVTINVTDVKLQVVTDQLAAKPDCAITVSPFIRQACHGQCRECNSL